MKPRGGMDAENASQYLSASCGDSPKYAFTYFLMCSVAFDIGRSWDSISPPLESRTITLSVETYGKHELKLVKRMIASNLSLKIAEGHFYKNKIKKLHYNCTKRQQIIKWNSHSTSFSNGNHIREAPRVKMLNCKDESKDLKLTGIRMTSSLFHPRGL